MGTGVGVERAGESLERCPRPAVSERAHAGRARAPGEEPFHGRVEREVLGSVVLVGPVGVPAWVIATVEHHRADALGKEVGIHRADIAAERATVEGELALPEGLAKKVDVAGDIAGADIRQQISRVLAAGSVEASRLPNGLLEGGCRRRGGPVLWKRRGCTSRRPSIAAARSALLLARQSRRRRTGRAAGQAGRRSCCERN